MVRSLADSPPASREGLRAVRWLLVVLLSLALGIFWGVADASAAGCADLSLMKVDHVDIGAGATFTDYTVPTGYQAIVSHWTAIYVGGTAPANLRLMLGDPASGNAQILRDLDIATTNRTHAVPGEIVLNAGQSLVIGTVGGDDTSDVQHAALICLIAVEDAGSVDVPYWGKVAFAVVGMVLAVAGGLYLGRSLAGGRP